MKFTYLSILQETIFRFTLCIAQNDSFYNEIHMLIKNEENKIGYLT